MIAIIDYGMGNLRSVHKALEAVGADAVVSSRPQTILDADSVVLPGVGAFKNCMDNLDRLGLIDVVRKSIQSGKPFLGICLGLQLLFEESVEFGTVAGLGILPGKVMRFHFPDDPALKVPHMGWNTLTLHKPSPLFDSMEAHPYYYFVHSYYVAPENRDIVATTTRYGEDFVSGIEHDNIHAFQFHPEKSQKQGLALLEKFARLN
ncbi:MAG: imidazole glycerol phosphate synthase subunit HisH [Nitrospinae bacterium]|nr:imidazole glycerol phosphate synthase subunit HisH [Nitrospinota bacterium]MCH7649844.1 imidazole glycerol phosphate synthase subunit HisH [Nitrospinota bacterium]MCH8933112.1 imidazole glycerol phosphate synthase subunit HisH [Nitrospinota bacterium]TDJ53049.1 MAG: imidazole glycerol phosphate synthase subunit HisH [Nitrospina sp.]TDJ60360.1 MAG: imidazole glycerol phosphate synthase subunit HisH [Nitrospina sp.]